MTTDIAPYPIVQPDDRTTELLRRHVREAHPNLLGIPDTWIGYAPLPESGLSRVPGWLLHAIHEANHAGLYRRHLDDELLPRPSAPSLTIHSSDMRTIVLRALDDEWRAIANVRERVGAQVPGNLVQYRLRELRTEGLAEYREDPTWATGRWRRRPDLGHPHDVGDYSDVQ